MTLTVSRIYQARENADAAAASLAEAGFTTINVIAPTEPPDEQMLAKIHHGGVTGSHAETYAEAIRRGETLVSVRAPFGTAVMATSILDKHGPTETGLGEQGYEKPPPDPSAPFSSACGWKVLIDDPAPFSRALGWTVISTSRKPRKPDAELIDNPAPLSAAFGAPLLTDRPTILSSRFGWRTLWDNPAPLSTRFRWPILSKEQKPPQSRFGAPLLSDDPAPLSSRVGWKLLSNDPAPLSRLLGLRVLSDPPK